jgi:hypothetical protein
MVSDAQIISTLQQFDPMRANDSRAIMILQQR